MSLKSHVIERFGGLNLLDDEQETQGVVATDLLNVELDRLGRLRRRDGFVVANDSTLASSGYTSLHAARTNGGVLLAGRPGTMPVIGDAIVVDRLEADGTLTNVGGIEATSTATRIVSAVDFGTPSSQLVFLSGVAAVTSGVPSEYLELHVYNGSSVISSTGSPLFVSVSPRGNRLVQAAYAAADTTPSGSDGSQSTVFFSNEGAPETYSSNNFVHLRPGDGERIVGMVVLRDLLMVFKQSTVFVFYGENTDDEGNTEFAYREVSLGEATIPLSTNNVVAGDDAVYFSAMTGIYRTTGDRPERISGEISPIYVADGDEFSVASRDIDPASVPKLSWADGRLFASYQTASGVQVLTWRPDTRQWSLWRVMTSSGVEPANVVSWPQEAAGTIESTTTRSVYMVFGSSSFNDIYRSAPDADDDDGTAFDWFYESSFYRLGSPGEKRVRFTDVYGSGETTVKVTGRGGRSSSVADAGSSLTLGTVPAVGRARRQQTVRGRMFAHRLSGTSTDGAARINSIEHYFSHSGRAT